MKFSLFTDEFKKEMENSSSSQTERSNPAAEQGFTLLTGNDEHLEVEPSSAYLAPLRRTPWKFNSEVLPEKAPSKRTGLRIALIITLITALAGAGTAYILLKTALADTVINKYLDHQITSGLVGHWTFDGPDITGTSTVLDRSSTHATGTTVNMATSSRIAGKMGQALQFDGSNDFVYAASSATTLTSYSSCSWIRPNFSDSDTSAQTVVTRKNNTGDSARSAELTWDGVGNRWFSDSMGALAYSVSDASTPFNSNEWHHICFTFGGSSDSGYFYWDGVAKTTTQNFWSGTGANITTYFPFYIGNAVNANYFNGAIDDVRIYNRALSAKEIKRLYKLGEGTKINTSPTTIVDDGLVGYWTFDGQNMFGNSAYDLSPTHATGTLTNMASSSRVMGKHGQALRFDGVNDFINAGSSESLDNLTQKTVSVWVQPTGIDLISSYIIQKATDPFGWSLTLLSSYNVQFNARWSVTASWYTLSRIPSNQWTHIVVTYDNTSTSNDPIFYVNGMATSSIEQTAPTGTHVNESAYDVRLGGSDNSFRQYIGTLDDVRIYNRILSADEIQKLYKAGEGVTVTADPFVSPFVCGNSVTFTYNSSPVTYGTVTGADGECWMDRNLGATRVALSSTDTSAYGDFFQWGRDDDGHQSTTSGTTATNADIPGHNLFITESSSPYDWRVNQDDTLWVNSTSTNNPCPSGWHVPTQTEWNTWVTAAGVTSGPTAYSSNLKLTLAAYRNRTDGSLNGQGSRANYWSSSPSGSSALSFYFDTDPASVDTANVFSRAYGLPVRCLKD